MDVTSPKKRPVCLSYTVSEDAALYTAGGLAGESKLPPPTPAPRVIARNPRVRSRRDATTDVAAPKRTAQAGESSVPDSPSLGEGLFE